MRQPLASDEPHLPSPDAKEATGEGAMRQAHKQAARAQGPHSAALASTEDGWPYRHTIRDLGTSPHEDWITSHTST